VDNIDLHEVRAVSRFNGGYLGECSSTSAVPECVVKAVDANSKFDGRYVRIMLHFLVFLLSISE
jgi:hypothetical protein